MLFLSVVFVAYWSEQTGNPIVSHLGVESHYTGSQAGGNMEQESVQTPHGTT